MTIKRPKTAPNRDEAPALALGLVEVREVVPAGKRCNQAGQPLLWRLVTTLPGPKTMSRGLDRLLERIEGFRAGNQRRNV